MHQTYAAGISLSLFLPGDNVKFPKLFTDTLCNFPFEISIGSVFAHILVVTAYAEGVFNVRMVKPVKTMRKLKFLKKFFIIKKGRHRPRKFNI